MSSLSATSSTPADNSSTSTSTSTSSPDVRPSPGQNKTIVSYVTATVTPTFIFTSPIVSTETTVRYTTIPGPDPAATAAIASASAVLAAAGSTKYDTKFIIIVSITGSTFLLILLLALICLLYLRHKRSEQKSHLTDTPPFTSLNAPRTPSTFAHVPSAPPQIPPQTYATSLSLGPTRNFSNQALAITTRLPSPVPNQPPTRPRRSISEPMLIPDHLRRDYIAGRSPTQRMPRLSTAQSPPVPSPPVPSPPVPRVPTTPSPLREPTLPEITMIPTTPIAHSPSPIRQYRNYSPPRTPQLTDPSPGNIPDATSATPRVPRFREGFPAHLMGERARIEADRRRRAREENAAAGVGSTGVGGSEFGSSLLVPFFSSGPNHEQLAGGNSMGLTVTGNEAFETQRAHRGGRELPSRDESGGWTTSTRASSGIFPD